MSTIQEASVYKAHRIHTTRLFSRPYVSMIVSLGKGTPLTTNSLTDTVTRVPGLYPFGFGHASGYGAVTKITTLERKGWVRVGAVPGLTGLWVMNRGNA